MWGFIAGLVGTGISIWGQNQAENKAFKQMQTQQLIAARQAASVESVGRDVLIAIGLGLVIVTSFSFAFEK